MSGIWETLFREEPQAWSTWISNNVEYLAGILVRLPEAILVITMGAILFVWEFICTLVCTLALILSDYRSIFVVDHGSLFPLAAWQAFACFYVLAVSQCIYKVHSSAGTYRC